MNNVMFINNKNAATATKLKTPVNIFGLSFDGSKDIVEDDNHKLVTKAEKIIIKESSNPNLLINGDFQVWQRGTEFIVPINIYTADRWKSISTNSSIAGNGIRKNVNGMEAMLCDQIVSYYMEEYDLNKIANKMVTLSWSINGQILTNTFICPSVNPVFHIGIGGGTILNWVKLELGEVATPFVPRPYAEELALCKRYYEKGFYVSQYTGNSVPANLPFFMPVRYTVEKRIFPTFTATSVTGTASWITGILDVYAGTGDDIFMATGGHTSNLQFIGYVGHNPVYHMYHFYWTADAEIY